MNWWVSVRVAVVGLMLSLASAGGSRPPVSATARTLAVTLAPIASTTEPGTIGTVLITLKVDGLATPQGAPLLRLPLVSSNVDTVATTLSQISAIDARGPLWLSHRDVDLPDVGMRDSVGGGPTREWFADRAVVGPLSVRYAVPAQATLPPRGPAPPFAFSADGGGVSAAGHVFLLLPPDDVHYRTTFGWDMSRAPAGSRGVSSLGEGDVTAAEALNPGQVRMSFFMAGRVGALPGAGGRQGFFGAWQGSPAFDAAKLLAWTGVLHDRYSAFFQQSAAQPYGVFLRYNPINVGGGVGLFHAFVVTFGKGRGNEIDKLRITLAHEMFHTFQPYIAEPAGLESSWFGEGLATFYQARLPFRFGMIGPDAFLADLNWTAARYYTSAMARVPNSEVPKRFWADTRVRTLPYDRGMLYFATVDDALRKRSEGKESLDTLMLAMLAIEKSGKVTTNADWETLLAQHLGPEAVKTFHDFLAGAIPVPGSAAFGPCFRRVVRPLRRYELGFATDVLAEPRRIVRRLVPGSAAAAAGLRNGDEIVDPVPQDGIQGEQHEMLNLRVRRGDRVFLLSYLPRGETVDAFQWEHVAGTKSRQCAR